MTSLLDTTVADLSEKTLQSLFGDDGNERKGSKLMLFPPIMLQIPLHQRKACSHDYPKTDFTRNRTKSGEYSVLHCQSSSWHKRDYNKSSCHHPANRWRNEEADNKPASPFGDLSECTNVLIFVSEILIKFSSWLCVDRDTSRCVYL